MQRLEVSGVVRLIYRSLGVRGLNKRLGGTKSRSRPQKMILDESYRICRCVQECNSEILTEVHV